VEIYTESIAAWTGVVDADGTILTLISSGDGNAGDSISVVFTGTANPWIADSGGFQTLPLNVTRTDSGETATINFMIETVPPPPSGLTVTDGETIISPYGSTSPLITITDSDLPAGSSITIDLYLAKPLLASWTFSDANIEVTSNSTTANWHGTVADDYLTLTSAGGTTLVGETINVTFTGTTGNPWDAYPSGMTYSLTARRSDGYDPEPFSISIDMVPQVSTGLSIENGMPITTTLEHRR
jgi:hypothetical protein